MSKYWSELTKKLEPYVPGEQPKDKKYVKLNTNENPFPPSPKVKEVLENMDYDDLKLYPDPNADLLKDSISKFFDVNRKQVFVGNGSDEVLAFAFMAFFNPEKPILFSDISYSFYEVYANIFNIQYNGVELNDNFEIPVEEFYKENGGIIIPNPNAPTGIALTLEQIEEILKNNMDNVVIIDEAYVDFGAETAIGLVEKYPNLLVVQTLSKSRSLAGMRVGFAIGNEELIEGLERVKNSVNSYTIDRVAMVVAKEAIEDKEYFTYTCNKIISTRENTIKELKKMNFKICNSMANFIFISHDRVKAKDLFVELKKEGVLVRYFNKKRIDNYLRVTIGSENDMEVFIEKIQLCLAKL
ncbi:histidinol-phosphate transaminase [Clostridium sediminicola]|uniref:histidinol-phosphate transaminase n=1 Tax=Clostridium sediminicola TaxID=3114879 RepID=UPI0031F258A6